MGQVMVLGGNSPTSRDKIRLLLQFHSHGSTGGCSIKDLSAAFYCAGYSPEDKGPNSHPHCTLVNQKQLH